MHIAKYIFFSVLAFTVFYGLVNIIYGISSMNLIQVFSSDETMQINQILGNLGSSNLKPMEFGYGYLYHTIAFFILKILALFGHAISVTTIASVFRLISLGAFIVVAILGIKLTQYIQSNKAVVYLTALLLISSPNLFFWAQNTHPDALALMLTTLCLLLVIRNHSLGSVLVASTIAGLSFGTKYSGVFLLPFISIPFLLKSFSEYKNSEHSKGKLFFLLLKVYTLAVLVFILAWFISNPYVIGNWTEFRADFIHESSQLAYGHGIKESDNSLLWFPIIAREFTVIGTILLFGGVLYWLLTVVSRVRALGLHSLNDAKTRSVIFLLLYLILTLIYFMSEINRREARYLFHLFPPFVILGTTGMYALIKYAQNVIKIRWIETFLLTCAFGGVLWMNIHSVLSTSAMSNKINHEYVQAGSFLEGQYNRAVKILADFYSYIPESFSNAEVVWGVDGEAIEKYKPQILILNTAMSGRWSWKENGTSFMDDKIVKGEFDNADHYYEFYKNLFGDDTWKIIYEGVDIVILEKEKGDDQPDAKLSRGNKRFSISEFELENFHRDMYWTDGNGVMKNINFSLQPSDKFLVLYITGHYPFQSQIKELGLKVFINEIEQNFVKKTGDYYYFSISESIKNVNTIRVASSVFIPKQVLENSTDGRVLGIGIESIEFVSG